MDLLCRHFIEGGGNDTLTDGFADGIQSIGIGRQFIITDESLTDDTNSKGCAVSDGIIDEPRKIWRVIKNSGAKFKIYFRILEKSPME
jgi:hypothetical protein